MDGDKSNPFQLGVQWKNFHMEFRGYSPWGKEGLCCRQKNINMIT